MRRFERRWTWGPVVGLFLLLGAPIAVAADPVWDDAALTGEVEFCHGVRLGDLGDPVTSRASLNLEGQVWKGPWSAMLSLDAMANFKIDDTDRFRVREGYLEWLGEGWETRIGRQILIWGAADGVQVTDRVSPTDMTESLTRELDEIRLGVDALRIRRLWSDLSLELIWIPFFREAILPPEASPWAQPRPGRYLPEMDPDTGLDAGEYGARLSYLGAGFDLSVCALYAWSDTPAPHPVAATPDGSIWISPRFHRVAMFGLDAARPVGDWVFRAEAAIETGMHLAPAALGDPVLQKDRLRTLVGADWSPGHDWTVSAQLLDTRILSPDDRMAARPRHQLMTLNLTKTLFRERVKVSNRLYFALNTGEVYDRFSVDVEVRDGTRLLAGLHLFDGEATGEYGRLRENSQVWVKLAHAF